MSARATTLAFTIAAVAALAPAAQAKQGYDYYLTGNGADVVTGTSGLLVLQSRTR